MVSRGTLEIMLFVRPTRGRGRRCRVKYLAETPLNEQLLIKGFQARAEQTHTHARTGYLNCEMGSSQIRLHSKEVRLGKVKLEEVRLG